MITILQQLRQIQPNPSGCSGSLASSGSGCLSAWFARRKMVRLVTLAGRYRRNLAKITKLAIHAKNICEHVIYMLAGTDVGHLSAKKTAAKINS